MFRRAIALHDLLGCKVGGVKVISNKHGDCSVRVALVLASGAKVRTTPDGMAEYAPQRSGSDGPSWALEQVKLLNKHQKTVAATIEADPAVAARAAAGARRRMTRWARARLRLIVKSLREIMPRVHELIARDELLSTFDVAKLFDEVTVDAVHGC